MRIFKKFKTVTICSSIVAVLCFFAGIVISYLYATPAGASVVMMNIFVFLLFWAVSGITRKSLRRDTIKKAALVSAAAVLLFSGCGSGKNSPENSVIEIEEKMFIAQINDVCLNSEDYMGKIIKYEGLFKFERGDDRNFCFVIRYGPGGCCGFDGSAGFEVSWDEPGQPPSGKQQKAYPKVDDWVEATGVLKNYEAYVFNYLYIALSELKVLEKRGAEFVSQ
jgi:hypothetical protein